jgi:hypothetical protein
MTAEEGEAARTGGGSGWIVRSGQADAPELDALWVNCELFSERSFPGLRVRQKLS